MESTAELREICRRENDEDNKKTMLFASRVSIYFTKLFLAMNLSANQVTYIFIVTGVLSAFAFLGPGIRWALTGYVLHRLHVIFDVSDGEVARYRNTFSSIGAYLDYLAHYFIYDLLLFIISARYYFDSGHAWAFAAGFVLVLANTMNRASCDCWFRANFGKSSREEIEEGRRREERSNLAPWIKKALLLPVHLTSVQTFLNLYLLALIADSYLKFDSRGWLITGYAVLLFSFSMTRIALTIRKGKIPRRATYY
ncbi:MAG: hypothetical protein B6D63_05030 [Candidatus Latescibacteria bacterium 4484_7]|nr:MAG: hypothetical protein B6D63_05030 [Candidatus Latescibacteria bacterium 4484_7]